mgnify:FL=1
MAGNSSVRFSPFRPRTMALLALAASVPLILLASFAGVLILRQQQEEMQETAREATFNLADMLRREFDAQVSVLKVMAASRPFDDGLDIREFRDLSERALSAQPNSTAITLNDVEGVRIASVPGDLHIGVPAKDLQSHELAVATLQPAIGNVELFSGEETVFAVRVPIVRDGNIKGVISSALKPTVLQAILNASRLSHEWISVIVDGNDRIVARAGDPGDFAAQPGSLVPEPARSARHGAETGVYRGRTVDGRTTNSHFRMLPGLRWSVHVAIPDKIYEVPVRRSIALAVSAGVIALAISGVFVTLLLRELRRGQEVGRKVEDGLRLEALGRVTGGVAHDFNNLLMIMMGGADILKARSGDSTRVQMIADTIASAAQRGRHLTTHLLAFARRSSHDPISFRIQDRIAHLSVMIQRAINPDIRLQIDVDPNTPAILADPNAFEVALINLAVNASDAMPDGGVLTIQAHALNTFRSPSSVSISVSDTGAGISQDLQEKIFEPFFTTVNGGRIPGQRGGVKAGHLHWGAADMARAPIGALAISRSRDCSGDDLAGFGIGFIDGGLVLLRRGGGAPATSGLPEAVAVAVHRQDADVVGQPVEQRAGQTLRSQDGRPVLEGQVRGDDGRAALIALREDLEQELGAGRRERHIAELVDDQQLDRLQLALEPEQALLVAGLEELADQGGRRGEGDGEALLARGQPERESDMGFARATVAQRDDVLPAQDVAAARQLQHEHLVQARDRREVEGVEALYRREPRRPDPPLDHAPFPVNQFEFDQPQQVAGMIDAVAGAFPRDLVIFAQDRRQLQLLEMMSQQNLRGRRHRTGRHCLLHAGHAAAPGRSTA